VENILSDALLRLYSNDEPGTVRARSEYMYHDILGTHLISTPVLVGVEGKSTGVPAPVDSLLPNNAVVSSSTGGQPVAGPSRPRGRHVVDLAKTGHPKTGKEFAARVKNHFVLRGPKERKEGEGAQSAPQKLTIKLPARVQQANIQHLPNMVIPNDGLVNQSIVEKLPDQEQLLDQAISDCSQSIHELSSVPTSLIDLVNGGSKPIDLIESVREQYTQDPLFSKVLQSPREFKTFKLVNNVLYLKLADHRVLCLPSIMTKG
jgi:hypothetical protein